MTAGHFHEFHLAVKGHHPHPMGRCILDLRNLLAGVCIDDSAWIHSQRLDQMNLILEVEEGEKNLVTRPASAISAYCHNGFVVSLFLEHLVLQEVSKLTLLAQSKPAPRDARVMTTARLLLHLTA